MNAEESISLGEVTLSVVTRGRGKPVVLLGGPWFGQTYMQPVAELLAGEFEVISYDPRGSGHSSVLPESEVTVENHLEDLGGLRDALGVERLNLVGHSLGALVLLLFAARFPEKAGSLVLAHPGPPFAESMMAELHEAFSRNQTASDKQRMGAIAATAAFKNRQPEEHEAFFKAMYSAFFSDRSLVSRLDFGFTEATATHALGAEEQLVREILSLDPASLLADVQCPTLVVHAANDLIPLSFSNLLAEEIPGATLVTLEGVGHFSYLENPPLFQSAVIPFLKRAGVDRH